MLLRDFSHVSTVKWNITITFNRDKEWLKETQQAEGTVTRKIKHKGK